MVYKSIYIWYYKSLAAFKLKFWGIKESLNKKILKLYLLSKICSTMLFVICVVLNLQILMSLFKTLDTYRI